MNDDVKEALNQGMMHLNHERYGVLLRILVSGILDVADAMPSDGEAPADILWKSNQWGTLRRKIYRLVGSAYPLRRWANDEGGRSLLVGDFNHPCPQCLGQGFMPEKD